MFLTLMNIKNVANQFGKCFFTKRALFEFTFSNLGLMISCHFQIIFESVHCISNCILSLAMDTFSRYPKHIWSQIH